MISLNLTYHGYKLALPAGGTGHIGCGCQSTYGPTLQTVDLLTTSGRSAGCTELAHYRSSNVFTGWMGRLGPSCRPSVVLRASYCGARFGILTCIAVRGECNRSKNSNWTQPINERYLCAHPVLRTDTVARAGLGSWSRPLSYTSVQRPKENCNPDTDYEVRVIHMDIYSGLDFTVLLARARWGRLGA